MAVLRAFFFASCLLATPWVALGSTLDLSEVGPQDFVRGSASLEAVRSGMKAMEAPLLACFQEELGRDPSAAGRVYVTMLITPDGTITSATFESSDLQGEAFQSCVQDALAGESLGGLGGGVVLTRYPMRFINDSPPPLPQEPPAPVQQEPPAPVQQEPPAPIQREPPAPVQREPQTLPPAPGAQDAGFDPGSIPPGESVVIISKQPLNEVSEERQVTDADRTAISRTIDEKMEALLQCFQGGLGGEAHINAQVSIRFLVAGTGEVLSAPILTGTSYFSADSYACLVQVVLDTQFAPTVHGDSIEVYVPLAVHLQRSLDSTSSIPLGGK